MDPQPEGRPLSYTLPGRLLVSSRTTLDKSSVKPDSSPKVRSAPTEPSPYERRDKQAPSTDLGQGSVGPKNHGRTGPRPPPTWIYRKQRYVTPMYQSGTKSNGELADTAKWGTLAEVKRLLKAGSHIESSHPPPPSTDDSPSPPRDTALTLSVGRGEAGFEIVKFLLECGADVNKAELESPVDRKDVEMTRLLLEYGFPTFYPVGYWLNCAVDLGSVELCELFLDCEANRRRCTRQAAKGTKRRCSVFSMAAPDPRRVWIGNEYRKGNFNQLYPSATSPDLSARLIQTPGNSVS
jgi:hypothetical protein